MYFRILHDERSGAVSYLLGDLDAGEAVLVDDAALIDIAPGARALLCWAA